MSRAATARLFVAVDPPPEARRLLVRWAREAALAIGVSGRTRDDSGRGERRLRLLDERALHLTLCFLGSRPVAEIETIVAALDGCDVGIGALHMGAPAWLPPRRPRALAVSVHDRDERLATLQRTVCRTLAGAVAWEPGRLRFRAHVTVARMSGSGRARRRDARVEVQLPPTPPLRFTPRSLVLYRSWLGPAGASYEAVGTKALMSSKPPASGVGVDGASAAMLQMSAEPSLEGSGGEPSSHSGSDSSSQE
jgi:RNA 2',3'-cyclic 3'-phosphodiesterase